MLNKKALAGTPSTPPVYVEDVFSTYLYTGNGTFSGETQAISNGIDLAGEGGMVWIKNRTSASTDNCVSDTVRGGTSNMLRTNSTAAATGSGSNISFQSTGFTCLTSGTNTNYTGERYASWTFRKAKKFFDVVTYTGDGGYKYINHNLGSTPGMIIVKRTDSTGPWAVWHRSTGNGYTMYLNTTAASVSSNNFQQANSTQFAVYEDGVDTTTNLNGATYVAYLFAHDAGGFGAAGTDNVISCGSFTTDGSGNATISLGYEPQWLMTKKSSTTGNWNLIDNMRGFPVPTAGSTAYLLANTSNAEVTGTQPAPTATGFTVSSGGANTTYIYMAIRRPMKTPTSGTEVFSPNRETATTNPQTLTTGFPVDLSIHTLTSGTSINVMDRLRGGNSATSYNYLNTNSTAAEQTGTGTGFGIAFDSNTAIIDANWWLNTATIFWNFRRATGFFDIVCYTGDGTNNRVINHNLGVVPELMIVKSRNNAVEWSVVNDPSLGPLYLNSTAARDTGTLINSWSSTSITLEFAYAQTNASAYTYVAYLFATVAGVSKVGSYTGDGTDGRVINCGFTGGARFVLIKSTSNTGNWRIWDTARGIVSGNDPFLTLNTTNAEVTNSDDIDPTSSGFIVNYNGNSAINESGWSYIFLAIA